MNKAATLWITTLCALMPVVTMATHKGASPIFYLLIVSCLVMVFACKLAPNLYKDYMPVFWAYSVPVIAILVSTVGHKEWIGTSFEAALRVSLGLPILTLGLLRADPRWLRHSMWGVYATTWLATAYIGYLALKTWPVVTRPLTEIYNAVSYGNLTLLLGTIASFSLAWSLTRYRRTETAFKVLTILVALAGFLLTQTRSGWIAVPIFILLALITRNAFQRPIKGVAVLVGVVCLAGAIGASSPALRQRAVEGYTEVMQCQGEQATANNSMCIRFQLWRAAWTMFKEQPFIGVGGENHFQEKMQNQYVAKGIVSPFVAQDFGEAHNDVMMSLANFGILGALGLLMMYFAPLWVFLRRLGSRYPIEIRSAAAMGACVCLGFAVFGLTELMFRGMRTIGFYTLFVALFMALSQPRVAAKT